MDVDVPSLSPKISLGIAETNLNRRYVTTMGLHHGASEMKAEVRLRFDGIGEVYVPDEFVGFLPSEGKIKVIDAGLRADEVLKYLSDGFLVIVTSGDFSDLKVLIWYVMRFRKKLVPRLRRKSTPAESRSRQNSVRAMAHRLMVLIQDGTLVGIENAPDLQSLKDWASWPVSKRRTYLVPMRRLSRIMTDMKRSREGIEIKALGERIIVLPHVYVPFDQSVVNLLDRHLTLNPGETVLDMGTGTGVLAFVGAKKGAGKTVATDILETAVENARINANRLGLEEKVEVRGPADLFEKVLERFDVILFNPPWILGEVKTEYYRSIFDPGGAVITRFIREVGHHLTEKGRVYLIYSDASQSTGEQSITRLKRIIADNDLRISKDWCTTRRSRVLGSKERVYLYEIVPFHRES